MSVPLPLSVSPLAHLSVCRTYCIGLTRFGNLPGHINVVVVAVVVVVVVVLVTFATTAFPRNKDRSSAADMHSERKDARDKQERDVGTCICLSGRQAALDFGRASECTAVNGSRQELVPNSE